MINVKNTSDLPLNPAGIPCRPGATVAIDERRWKQYAGTAAGKNLLRLGMLEDGAAKAKVKPKSKPAPKEEPKAGA